MSTLVSLDLDDLGCYAAIHGLDVAARRGLALEVWLPRFLDPFAKHEVHATIFVIGSDLEHDLRPAGAGRRCCSRALAEGHELGNHSYSHAYELHRWPAEAIAADLRRCDTLLRELGAVPKGFRAPGYTHDRAMLMQVSALGYAYDSSLLPSPSYYLGKLGVLGLRRLRGRRSASQTGGARSFVGPTAVHYLPELGLWEVPISVSQVLRLPLIGTFVLGDTAPMMSQAAGRALRKRPPRPGTFTSSCTRSTWPTPRPTAWIRGWSAKQRELRPRSSAASSAGRAVRARRGGVPIARAMSRHLR